MKRRIGLFMAIILLITSIPVSSLADTSYPPVTVTFEAYSPDRSLEKEFRALAALQMEEYHGDYAEYVAELYEACDVIQDYRSKNTFGRLSLFSSDYSFNENIASFDDYYHENPDEATAYFKLYYMERLASSVQERIALQFNREYSGTWKNVEYNPATGTWDYSLKLDLLNEMDEVALYNQAINTAIDALSEWSKTYNKKVNIDLKDNQNIWEALINFADKTATSIVDDIAENLMNEFENALIDAIRVDIANDIISADEAAIQYLKTTFVESKNTGEVGRDDLTVGNFMAMSETEKSVFMEAVDELIRLYEAQKGVANTTAYNLVKDISIWDGVDKKAVCEGWALTGIIALEVIKETFNTVIDLVAKDYADSVKEKMTENNKTPTSKDASFTSFFAGTFPTMVKECISTAIDARIESIKTSGDTSSFTFENLKKAFKEGFRDSLLKIIEGYAKSLSKWDVDSVGEDANAILQWFVENSVKITECAAHFAKKENAEAKAILDELEVSFTDAMLKVFLETGYNEQSLQLSVWMDKRYGITSMETIAYDVLQKITTVDKGGKTKLLIDIKGWAEVGVNISLTASKAEDVIRGNAAADSLGRDILDFKEAAADAIARISEYLQPDQILDPEQSYCYEISRKVEQILERMQVDRDCLEKLMTLLEGDSSLKEAIVKHFKKEHSIDESTLKNNISDHYTQLNAYYIQLSSFAQNQKYRVYYD